MKNAVRNWLSSYRDKQYKKRLEEKKGNYHSWILTREEQLKKNRISQIGRSEAKKPEIVYFFYDRFCGTGAEELEEICSFFFECHPETVIAYGDEDTCDPETGRRTNPVFRPEWSPDLYLSVFYFGNVVAVRKSFLESAGLIGCESSGSLTEYLDLCVEKAGGFQKGCKAIGHISEILFHNKKSVSTRYFEINAERTGRYLQSLTGSFLKLARDSKETASKDCCVSVIIPSKDHPELLRKCISAVNRNLKNIPAEILVVDNGSSPENRTRIEKMISEYRGTGSAIRYLYEKSEFNFSYMCNLGAKQASGKFLLFLNDDVELTFENTIMELAALADRKFTGAVGLKLFYPDSARIQHAGITNLATGPVHKMQFMEDEKVFYGGMNRGLQNCIAVTAACLMVDKEKFRLVGGFCEDLKVAFNDVDLCFKLWEAGYYQVCDNELNAYHYESLTRGNDESEEKLRRLLRERDQLYQMHPKLEGKDPFFPNGLDTEHPDTSIRPEYETAGNRIQICEKQIRVNLSGYRCDPCLLLRIEWSKGSRIQGYAVVLGDDNACYKKALLLKENSETERIYAIELEEQYRPELIENMPDQKNVGLCGFHVQLSDQLVQTLGDHDFVIGAAATGTVNRVRLYFWSSRTLRCVSKDSD